MAAPAAAAPELCPSFAVLCGFLERYGAALDLPRISFPQMERYLRDTSAVPQPLVDLHVKLLRKLGKSVTSDRWEKYLSKMSMENKSTILKYLCECQFDDNLKFKAVVNEEESEKMRLQPIGRDRQGLLYWLQLDPEQNIRLYTEEQDDLDGSSWRCIVRTRNDLAEALDLLKTQIDPNHNKTKGESASGSPNREDKKDTGEDADGQKKEEDSGDHLDKKNLSIPCEPPKTTEEEPSKTTVLPLKTEESSQQAAKQEAAGLIKQEEAGLVKQEKAELVKQEEAEVDLKARPAELATDRKSPASFPVIDNRVSTITAIIKPDTRDADVPSNAVSVVMAPASVITKQEVNREEEAERAVSKDAGQPPITPAENAPRLELTNGKAALPPLPPHKEGGQNGVIGVIGQVGVIGHVGVIRSPIERHRAPGAESQERNGPGGDQRVGEDGGDGPGGTRRSEGVGRWEEKEREGNRQSVLEQPQKPPKVEEERAEKEDERRDQTEKETMVKKADLEPSSDMPEAQGQPGLLKVASSELQKEGIRSARICRPSSKVAESQDKSGQKTGKRRHRRPRWSTPRSKRRRLEGEGGERGRGQEESDGGRDSVDSSQSGELPMEDILLCDSCDSGFHTACLRPPLMLIPDGEWYCPPCQHKLLCERLEEQLLNLDSNLKKRERALRRKERLVYVGISVENIIPEGDVEPLAEKSEKKKDSKKSSKNLGRRSTRTRKCISYRFDDFDDAIDEAIEEDVGDVYGGAGAGPVRGKDIKTILSDEGKESERPIKSQARTARNRKRRRLNDLESDSTAAESEEEFMLSNSGGGSGVSGRRSKRGAAGGTARGTGRGGGRGRGRKSQQHRAKKTRHRRPRSSEEEEGETEEEMDSDWSSDLSDSEADRKRKGLRRGQRQQVNYRETSESSDNSRASANQDKENKPRLKQRRQRLSSDYSDGKLPWQSCLDVNDGQKKVELKKGPFKASSVSMRRQQRLAQMLKKRRPSTDESSDQSDNSEDSDSSSEEDRPVRKRLNRIDSDDEDDDNGRDEEDDEGDKETKSKKASEKESRVAGGDSERGDGDEEDDNEEDGAQLKRRGRSPPPTDDLRTSRGPAKPGPGSAASPIDSAGRDKLGRPNGPLPPEEDTQTDSADLNNPSS
ncbi:hypothetical protein NHX12_008209 [Muraenolepis orangiensis]|uniref:Zinc finger PHD-type domain-containing protein n=1 Tax=Muraenolepis orangiensis TaxID=630683 RepID=A0A9Q0DNF0_9TELE|nr:hypothetical protein NHX12_008209 [Muraenolepis orangiensis]